MPLSRQELIEWKPRWYYVMENITTGKLYFGQTIRDLDKYKGSGIYWKRHCKKHGGYTHDNIIVKHKWWIDSGELAELLVEEFAAKEGQYWLEENTKWANQVEEDVNANPFFKSGSELSKKYNQQALADGTHIFLKGNRTAAMDATQFTSERSKQNNADLIAAGTHHLLKENETESMRQHRATAGVRFANKMQKLLEEGNHPSARPEVRSKIGTANAVHNKERVVAGTHQYQGGFYAVTKSGATEKVSSDEYKSQTGPSEDWDYVHPKSTEGKRRRAKCHCQDKN